MAKIILITGASLGMGLETAKLLAQQGDKVYAGARRVEHMESLKSLRIIPVQMNI